MDKIVIVEVRARTATAANREASTLACLSLAQKDNTVKVLGVSTRFMTARSIGSNVLWTLECTVKLLGKPCLGALVPMPV